jgi:hypothetical protein
MSQETGMQPVSSETATVPPQRSVRWLAAVIVTWLRTDLFRRTESGPVGWRKIVLAVGCVIAGVAISVSRTVGPGSLNTVWIEDAKFLLSQGLNMPVWQAIASPISSYYQEPARLITEGALRAFPLSWVPGVMAIGAAAEYVMYGLVAYIASGPHLRSPWLRLLIAAPVCAMPLAYTQVNNDLVTVQFIGLYGAFWTVLWLPGTRAGKILAPIVMATVSWTAVLSVVVAPLVIARLIVDRSKSAWCLAILWVTGVWLQFSETILGQGNHNLYGNNGLFWVLRHYLTRVIPRAIFGERSLGGPGNDYRGNATALHVINHHAHDALIAGAWLIVLIVIAIAVSRFTDPNWTLAVVAAVFSVCVFIEETLINMQVVQARYVIAPALLLWVAIVALLRPRQVPAASTASTAPTATAGRWLPAVPTVSTAVRWLPVAGFALLLAVAVTLNFRVTNGRTTSPAWTSVVASATNACASSPHITAYTFVHEWWWVTIPCDKVR